MLLKLCSLSWLDGGTGLAEEEERDWEEYLAAEAAARLGGSTRSTSGSYETHKVFRVVGYVICETDTDFLGVAEVAIQLIGESVVETIT